METIRTIITGATGMVGEGVLHECLQHPGIEKILLLQRKSSGIVHPKLKELIHPDFFDLSEIAGQLTGYNSCFFCLGVSSVGMDKDDYYRLTYTLTLNVAETLVSRNPDMTFCYVSGMGTDSTEKGRSNWARVKGKTENALFALPFRKAFAFRPGFIRPIKGLKHTHSFYKYINWLFPIGRILVPGAFVKLEEVGLALIHAVGLPRTAKCLRGKTSSGWHEAIQTVKFRREVDEKIALFCPKF